MMRELFMTGTIMTEQTFILGKDAALEDSISKFQQKLTALGFNIEEASGFFNIETKCGQFLLHLVSILKKPLGLILCQTYGLYIFVIKIAHNVSLTVKARAKKLH